MENDGHLQPLESLVWEKGQRSVAEVPTGSRRNNTCGVYVLIKKIWV